MAARTDQLLRHIRRLACRPASVPDSDPELLGRFVRGRDEDAFAALVRRHGPMVLSVCRRILGDVHRADDAFQATWLVLARKAASVRPPSRLAAWLYGVARHVAWRILRDEARRSGREARQALPAPTSRDPLDVLSGRELVLLVDEEVLRLPEAYRLPVLLCCLEGRSQEEAARQLGWTVGSVKGRLERGRARLHARLVKRGLSLSVVLGGMEASRGVTAPLAISAGKITQAALAYGAGQTGTGTGVSVQSAALAEAALQGMAAAKLKVLTVLLVLFAGVVVSAAGLARKTFGTQPPGTDQATLARAPGNDAASKIRAEVRPRADQYGDPLPPDAVTRLGTTRFCCNDHGWRVAFKPDGSKILVATWSGVFVLDATTGKQLGRIAAKRGVSDISLSPSGKLLAVGASSADGIQIWDLATEQLLRKDWDTGPQREIWLPCFSPDGKMLASYSAPNSSPKNGISLWDPATGKEIRHWMLASESGDGFTFSPDSKTLIVADLRTIHFWNIATGREVRRIVDHPGVSIHRVVLSPDGKLLATQGRTAAPKLRKALEGGDTPNNKVHLWDAATGKKVRQIEVIGDSGTRHAKRLREPSMISHFQFSPDSKTLVTASDDGLLRIWDVATGKELRRWEPSGWVSDFAFSPDGKTLASLGIGNTVRFWDVGTGKELSEHTSHRTGFHFLALSPDGRTLASAGWDRDVRLWNTATGRQHCQLTADEGNVSGLQFSADGRTLTTLGDDGNARVWGVATGQELRQFPLPIKGRGSWRHVLSGDGKTWASVPWGSTGAPNPFVVWDAATGKKRQLLLGNEWWVGALAFSPDSRSLYSWTGDRKVRLWDLATSKRVREFAAGERDMYAASFSPDGNWFACGGRMPVLLLYDMATGTAVRRIEVPAMEEHENNARGIAFSSDGRTLAVGDGDGAIHLVELATGKFRRHLVGGHQGTISALLFSQDGTRLVSGSIDTTALVWDLTGRLGEGRKPLSAADLGACWTDLAGENAERAYQAIRRLAASPTQTLPYLEKSLQPAANAEGKHLARLIADLESKQFTVRKQASKDLENLGEVAISACRKGLASKPSPELRRRLELLVEKQEQERWSPSPQRLRNLRALEVLEMTGTPKARQLLQKLADGASESYLTREAKAALERLARR